MASAELIYGGISESVMEFGTAIPGTYNKDYTEPDTSTIPYWRDLGLNVFRLPFLWERAQPTAGGPFNETYVGLIDDFVNKATSDANGKINVLLDPHNYARYYGKIIGVDEPVSTFTTFWTQLANRYKDKEGVIFGLMNEPYGLDASVWAANAQAGIDAIRATGATNLITVPGVSWTGAHSWIESGNADAFAAAPPQDPLNNWVFEMHQYFDSDYSGTNPVCTHSTEVFTDVTAWLQQHGFKAILGEMAASTDASCNGVVENVIRYLAANDAWEGFMWWAAGPWWGNSWSSLEPSKGQSVPNAYLVAPFFPGNSAVAGKPYPTQSITIPAPSPTPTRPVPTVQPTQDLAIFTGGSSLGAGWQDWSWNTVLQYTSTVGPAPLVGTNNLVATISDYGGFSVEGLDFTYLDSLVFWVAADKPSFSIRISSFSETYDANDVDLTSACQGSFSSTTFIRCQVKLEPLGFHAWDRVSILSHSTGNQTLIISDAVIYAQAGDEVIPGGGSTATTTVAPSPTPLPTHTSDTSVYDGTGYLAAGWQDWSWGAINDFASTSGPAPITGSYNLKANLTNYGGASFYGVTFGGYKSLVFYAAGDSNWGVRLENYDASSSSAIITGDVQEAAAICNDPVSTTGWTRCFVTLDGTTNWNRMYS
ncbi:hypothetical protein HDV00_004016 [Rhizophlyctis rosea]|nr:hypothetical protein HDV00_004016 [Rhizophlyctis rosea]